MTPDRHAAPEPRCGEGPASRALPEVIRFFEQLSRDDLTRIGSVYAPDARFRDPFSEVRGVEAITGIFAHMFERLEAPRFIICDRIVDNDQAFLTWDFEFSFRRGNPSGVQRIHGGSHLRFDPDGRIVLHRDYWDAAEELYEKLPVLGPLMRWLRRKAAG